MKKLLLLAAVGIVSGNCYAQEILSSPSPATVSTTDNFSFPGSGAAQKSTGLSDTLYFANSGQTAGTGYSAAYYDLVTPVDSGRFFGMNKFGYKGFAQLYRFSAIDRATPVDTTYNVLGLVAAFTGTVVPSSTKSVTLTLWKRDAIKHAIVGRPKFYIYGAPATTVTGGTKNITFPNIALGTLKPYYFTAPVTGINHDIYAGYTLSSYSYTALGGDTIGLVTSANTQGGTYTIETGTLDSLVSVNTLIQEAGGAWKSPGFDPALFRSGDLVLFPIIQLSSANIGGGGGVSVPSMNVNEMTFFGNFPNPAVGYTNVKLALKSSTDVTVTVMDATGKVVNNIQQNGLSVGEHMIRINTETMAAGTYVYVVRTSNGDGIAAQFTIAK